MAEKRYCNQGKLREKEEKNKHGMIQEDPQKPTEEKYSTTQGKQAGGRRRGRVERENAKETSSL